MKFYSFADIILPFILLSRVSMRMIQNRVKVGTFFLHVDSYDNKGFWNVDNSSQCVAGSDYSKTVCEVHVEIVALYDGGRMICFESAHRLTKLSTRIKYGKKLNVNVTNPIEVPIYSTDKKWLYISMGVWGYDNNTRIFSVLDSIAHNFSDNFTSLRRWTRKSVHRKTRKTNSGEFGQTSLSYAYKLECEPLHFGSMCNVWCKPEDGRRGHFTCNSEGGHQCIHGWKGLPNCRIPITLEEPAPKGKRGTFYFWANSYSDPYFRTINDDGYCEGSTPSDDDCEVYITLSIKFTRFRRFEKSWYYPTPVGQPVNFGTRLGKNLKNPVDFDIYSCDKDDKLHVKIGIYDHDPNSEDEKLEELEFKYVQPLMPTPYWKEMWYPRNRKDNNGKVYQSKLIFSYKLMCEPHYFGGYCQVWCIPQDGVYGHYDCDSSGRHRCKPGWQGLPYCKTKAIP